MGPILARPSVRAMKEDWALKIEATLLCGLIIISLLATVLPSATLKLFIDEFRSFLNHP